MLNFWAMPSSNTSVGRYRPSPWVTPSAVITGSVPSITSMPPSACIMAAGTVTSTFRVCWSVSITPMSCNVACRAVVTVSLVTAIASWGGSVPGLRGRASIPVYTGRQGAQSGTLGPLCGLVGGQGHRPPPVHGRGPVALRDVPVVVAVEGQVPVGPSPGLDRLPVEGVRVGPVAEGAVVPDQVGEPLVLAAA